MLGMGVSARGAAQSATRITPGMVASVLAAAQNATRIMPGMDASVLAAARKTTILKKSKRTNIRPHAATAQATPALAQIAVLGVTAIQVPDTVMSVCAVADVERWRSGERGQKNSFLSWNQLLFLPA